MLKFENGERKFKKDQFVYYYDKSSGIGWPGTIESYWGFGKYRIAMYERRDFRLINGVPIDEVDTEKVYNLPKNWSYNMKLFDEQWSDEFKKDCEILKTVKISDEEKIKQLISDGILVKKKNFPIEYISDEILDDGKHYKLKKVYGEGSNEYEKTVSEDLIFTDWKSVKHYAKMMDEIAAKRKAMFAEMTEDEIVLFETQEQLEKWEFSAEDVKKCMDILNGLVESGKIATTYDIDIRRRQGCVEYFDVDRKWIPFFKFNTSEEQPHSERYFVRIYLAGDLDQENVDGGFANEPPKYWIDKYNDLKHIISVYDREWTEEKALEMPKWYEGGLKSDRNGSYIPTMNEVYDTKYGTFCIQEGKLLTYDIGIDSKHRLNNFWLWIYGKTSKTDKEIRDWFKKKIECMGKFAPMFREEIDKIEEIKVCKV